MVFINKLYIYFFFKIFLFILERAMAGGVEAEGEERDDLKKTS